MYARFFHVDPYNSLILHLILVHDLSLFQFSGSVTDFKIACEPSSLYRLTAFTIPAPVKYFLGFVSFQILIQLII